MAIVPLPKLSLKVHLHGSLTGMLLTETVIDHPNITHIIRLTIQQVPEIAKDLVRFSARKTFLETHVITPRSADKKSRISLPGGNVSKSSPQFDCTFDYGRGD